MKIRSLVLLTLGILLFGLWLRTAKLNTLPVFADEAIYVRWAQVMRAESTLRFLPLSDGKQPLFMWSVIPFLKFIPDPLIAGRLVSVFAGLATAIGTGFAAWLLFKNQRLAIFSAFIWAILPYSVFFDRLALADSLLTMFIVWTFALFTLSLSRLRWDFSMLAGFSLGFAWLTKSPALFAFFMIPLIAILFPDIYTNRKKLFTAMGLAFTTYLIALGMYNILRLGPEFHMIALRNRDYVFPLMEVLSHPLDPLISHLRDSFDFYIRFATPAGLVLALIGLFTGGRHYLRPRLVLAFWWLVPILAQSFVAKGFTARYLLFTVPFSVILMSYGLLSLGDRTKKHLLTQAGLAIMVVFCLGFDLLIIYNNWSAPLPRIERSGYLEEWTSGYGLREASERIRSAAANGPVVVGSEGYFGTPFSALEMYLNDVPSVRVVGLGRVIGAPDPKLTSAQADNQVFVVANSTRISGDPQELGYEIISSHPKAVRPDGSREYLLFMKIK